MPRHATPRHDLHLVPVFTWWVELNGGHYCRRLCGHVCGRVSALELFQKETDCAHWRRLDKYTSDVPSWAHWIVEFAEERRFILILLS